MHLGDFPIFYIFNLFILICLFAFFLKKPIIKYLKERSEKIESDKKNASENFLRLEIESQKNHNKLLNINSIMQKMMDDAETEGERQAQKMLFQIEKIADRIIENSMIRADQEVSRKNREFYRETVEKSIKKAENELINKLKIKDNIRLTNKYLDQLNTR